jgi:hypothetical protein
MNQLSRDKAAEHSLHVTLLRSRFCDWSPALPLGCVDFGLVATAAHVSWVFGFSLNLDVSNA